jgi:hypothetical protein
MRLSAATRAAIQYDFVPNFLLSDAFGGSIFVFSTARYGELVMGTIVEFMRDGAAAFDPQDIQAMSTALDQVCHALKIEGDTTAREVVATRIIELARRGERNPMKLRDHVLADATGGTG